MARGEADPAATRVGVQVRSALALQVGQEYQSITACGNTGGLFREHFIGVHAGPTLQGTFGQTDIIAYPVQREASSLRHTHQIPGIGHRVIEGMHSWYRTRGIDLRRFSISKHDAASTHRDEG